ncbi:hypothetical protein JVU11DRAFT_2811 [Chiua virens]|nr:hypothetical protein JVU11DRAFT_2811 [Chiua virens]
MSTPRQTSYDLLCRLVPSSKELLYGLYPTLYSDVQLVNIEQCRSTLTMLNRRPDISRHVQKLLICFSTKPNDLNGNIVSGLVQRLAHSLDALHTFIWDADEIPQRDDMWFALRMSCPRLTTVGTSYGSELLDSRSNFFQFKGLRGFVLNVKRGFYERLEDVDLQGNLSVHPRSQHVSNAEQSFPPNPGYGICSFACIPCVTHTGPDYTHSPWATPYSIGIRALAHPKLRSLRTSRAALNPALLNSLTDGSLPALTHFSGAIEHLQALAPIHHQITSVALDEPLIIRDLAPSLLASVLRGLKSLTELRVSFVFLSAYEGGSLVRSIAHACPGLTKLEVVCSRKSSFTVDALAKAVRSPSPLTASPHDPGPLPTRRFPLELCFHNRTHTSTITIFFDHFYSTRLSALLWFGNKSHQRRSWPSLY